MGKARIGRGESSWLKMHGKVIDGGSTRRPGPYPHAPKSRSSKTTETGETFGNHRHEIIIIPDDSESESEPDCRTDLGDAAIRDIWPEQFPAEFDMKKLKRYCKRSEPFRLAKERLTEKQRTHLYGTSSLEHILIAWTYIAGSQRHMWLPDSFGRGRGRPYERTCERVWGSWKRCERDMFARAIRSVEESDSKCPTPVTLRFPKRRFRHDPKSGASNATSSPVPSSNSAAASTPTVSSSRAPGWRQQWKRPTTSELVELGLRCSDPVRNQLSKDLLGSLLRKLDKIPNNSLSDEDKEQLRIESEEALRRIRQEQDKVLVGFKTRLIKFLKSKRS